jgi:hypothetical protein
MIHFISSGEGADLIEKGLQSIATSYDEPWQSFGHLAKIPRCILDDVVELPIQLILKGADIESVWDFYNNAEEAYMPIYANELNDIPVHFWCIISPVGGGKKAREFVQKIAEGRFLEDFRWTFLIPEKFKEGIFKIIGEENTILLPDQTDLKLADLCYTAADGSIRYSMIAGKGIFSRVIKAERLIRDILKALE